MFAVICLPSRSSSACSSSNRHAPTVLTNRCWAHRRRRIEDRLAASADRHRHARGVAVLGAVAGSGGGIGGIAARLAAMYNEKVGIPWSIASSWCSRSFSPRPTTGSIANPLFTGVLGSQLVPDPDARSRTLRGEPHRRVDRLPHRPRVRPVRRRTTCSCRHGALSIARRGPGGRLVRLLGLVLLSSRVRCSASRVGGSDDRRTCRGACPSPGRRVQHRRDDRVHPDVPGETQSRRSSQPEAYGPAALLVMAIVKLALLAVAFKSGLAWEVPPSPRSSPRCASPSR